MFTKLLVNSKSLNLIPFESTCKAVLGRYFLQNCTILKKLSPNNDGSPPVMFSVGVCGSISGINSSTESVKSLFFLVVYCGQIMQEQLHCSVTKSALCGDSFSYKTSMTPSGFRRITSPTFSSSVLATPKKKGTPLDSKLESISFVSVTTPKCLIAFLVGESVTKIELYLYLLSVPFLTILPINGFLQLYEQPDNILNFLLSPQMGFDLSKTRTLY